MKKFDYEGMMHRWEIAKRKSMIEQIENKKEKISLFNARKSLYVEIDNSLLGKFIMFLSGIMVKRQLRKLDE